MSLSLTMLSHISTMNCLLHHPEEYSCPFLSFSFLFHSVNKETTFPLQVSRPNFTFGQEVVLRRGNRDTENALGVRNGLRSRQPSGTQPSSKVITSLQIQHLYTVATSLATFIKSMPPQPNSPFLSLSYPCLEIGYPSNSITPINLLLEVSCLV